MKFQVLKDKRLFAGVAPFAGAWIEIMLQTQTQKRDFVAPFAGAWIEMTSNIKKDIKCFVAPFAGAWIEMARVQ